MVPPRGSAWRFLLVTRGLCIFGRNAVYNTGSVSGHLVMRSWCHCVPALLMLGGVTWLCWKSASALHYKVTVRWWVSECGAVVHVTLFTACEVLLFSKVIELYIHILLIFFPIRVCPRILIHSRTWGLFSLYTKAYPSTHPIFHSLSSATTHLWCCFHFTDGFIGVVV